MAGAGSDGRDCSTDGAAVRQDVLVLKVCMVGVHEDKAGGKRAADSQKRLYGGASDDRAMM